MNRTLKIKLFILCSFIFIACQTEEYEVLTEEAKAASQEDSDFYNLVQRSVMYDGSLDDQIDDSPCFSIRFPYEVTLNGVSLKIKSSSELEALLENLEGTAGRNELSIEFPVTLKMSDYKNVSVNSRQEFLAYRQACREETESGRGAVTCVEIDFPVKVLVYKTGTQRTNSANIANEEQLFVFMNNRAIDEIFGFVYPFSLRDANESNVEVYNRAQFEDALSQCLE